MKHYLRPQFKQLGKGGAFFKPQYLKLFGSHISVDDFPTIIGARDANVQLTSWNIGDWKGELKIGKYCLITPGVRIMAAESEGAELHIQGLKYGIEFGKHNP